jgi:hypothetical protein
MNIITKEYKGKSYVIAEITDVGSYVQKVYQ